MLGPWNHYLQKIGFKQFGSNWVRKSWDIPGMDKCCQYKCYLDNCSVTVVTTWQCDICERWFQEPDFKDFKLRYLLSGWPGGHVAGAIGLNGILPLIELSSIRLSWGWAWEPFAVLILVRKFWTNLLTVDRNSWFSSKDHIIQLSTGAAAQIGWNCSSVSLRNFRNISNLFAFSAVYTQ